MRSPKYFCSLKLQGGCSIKSRCLPISSKRSTQTTNTFVSGPSAGKDFPVDDLFVFTKGLSYRKSTKHSESSKHYIKQKS